MAKKLTEEDIKLNLIVNGNQAQAEYSKLGRTIRDANFELKAVKSELKAMEAEGKANTASYKDLTKQMKDLEKTIGESSKKQKELTAQMKIEDKTIEQLNKSIRSLRAERSKVTPDSKEYKQYNEQLHLTRQRLKELEYGAQQTGNSLINMSGGLNRYVSSAVAGVASIVAVTSGIQKAKRDFAEFDDIMSDVQKTTNATKEEVIELDKALRQLDTRTSDEDLLGLGRIAGKLGYSDLQEIQEFIGATNQIVVALNQDLGGNVEETVNKIGKLIDIFQLRDIYDTEEAFLKVGSAINELGMASTANEGYMVEFARRMAGIAPLAGISIEEILGLGATLDQLGQTAEVSSTSLSKLFLGIAKDAENYAKYAGMQVTEFKDLLEKDFMQAFTKVLRGVKGSAEGINELAATLGDLGQDGGRVIGVIGSLANNVDVLQQQIDLSNKAMQEGTSITEEYNIKNSNAAAQLDKARNEVSRLWRELGRNLWPTFTVGNNLMITFLQALRAIIEFITDNYKAIAVLTLTITAYTIALNAATLATYAKSRATAIATATMRIFNSVVRANPLGLFLTALTAVTSAIILYRDRTDAATRATEAFNKAKEEIADQAKAETTALERNLKAVNDRNLADNERLAAVKELRDIMPDILKAYTDEEILIGKATKAIKDQIAERIKLSTIKAYESKLDDLALKRVQLEDQKERGQSGASMSERIKTLPSAMMNWSKSYEDIVDDSLQEVTLQEEKFTKELLRLQGNMAKIIKPDPEDEGGGGGGNSNGKKDSDRHKLALEREKQYWEDLAATQEEGYNRELHMLDKRYAELLKMQGISEADRTRISEIYLNQRNMILLDIEQKNNKEYRDTLRKEWEATYKEALADQDRYYLERLEQINNAQMSEFEKEVELTQLQEDQKIRRQELEAERLNTRLLNLEAIIEIGNLEIEEQQRVADEIAAIQKQQVDNAISEAQREQSQRLEIEKQTNQALEEIKLETVKAYEAAFSFMGDVFRENTELANIFLVLEKAAAAAYVITNLQKEIAGYYAAAALQSALNPFATALAAKKAAAAKIRAGISLATIAGTTISGIASNSKKSQNKVSGRESGGFFDITRAQDGRRFRSRYRPDQRGYVNQPTVLVGENGTEWVASAQALSNPDVSRIISILDTAQRQGQISTIGLSDILTQSGLVNRMTGRNSGGSFTETPIINNTTDFTSIEAVLLRNSESIDRLYRILESGITAEVALTGRKGLNAKQAELDKIRKTANL